jgi:hypothetical protein
VERTDFQFLGHCSNPELNDGWKEGFVMNAVRRPLALSPSGCQS